MKKPASLLKVWCAVHRSQLAWQSVSNTVVEVKLCFQSLTSMISSFFHSSAVLRTQEVKKLAKERNLVYVHLPSVFEVRWSEFSYCLLNAVLRSWFAIVSFWQNPVIQQLQVICRITSEANMKLMTFLADVLYCFSQFQQRLQKDTCTVALDGFVSNTGSKTTLCWCRALYQC